MAQTVRTIEVRIYRGSVYLDGVRCINEELEALYNEMYKSIQAKYKITFV